MEKNKEKELEIFVKKLVKEAGLEEPTPNFTDLLMSKIQMSPHLGNITYRPLISKATWWMLALVVAGLFTYVLTQNSRIEIPWLSSLKLEGLLNSNYFDKVSYIHISDTMVYGIVGLAFFIGIQVFLLKQHFDSRLALG